MGLAAVRRAVGWIQGVVSPLFIIDTHMLIVVRRVLGGVVSGHDVRTGGVSSLRYKRRAVLHSLTPSIACV